MNKEKSFNWIHFFIKILFILISAFLFFIANPNPIVKKGFPLAGWFIYLPVLILLRNCSIKNAWIYGVLYGLLSSGSYGYWLNRVTYIARKMRSIIINFKCSCKDSTFFYTKKNNYYKKKVKNPCVIRKK